MYVLCQYVVPFLMAFIVAGWPRRMRLENTIICITISRCRLSCSRAAASTLALSTA